MDADFINTSKNIEIECLGKTAMYGSAETQSALSCLEEVSTLRHTVVNAAVARLAKRESLSPTAPIQILRFSR